MTSLHRAGSCLLGAAVAAVLLSSVAADAQARLFKSATSTVAANSAELGGHCRQPCITYRHHRGCKVCCECKPPIDLVLEVKDPCCCDGCPVAVPVCLPYCCTGEPCVTTRCGLFGRGIVEYCWDCGFRVKIVFTRHGDLIVHTYGS